MRAVLSGRARGDASTVDGRRAGDIVVCASLLICINAPFVGAWRKSVRCNTTTEFECKTGIRCLPVDQVCDRQLDCHDGSDEQDCHCVQSWHPPMHRCRNRKCVDHFYTCNGKDDCGDGGSDEENCACYGFRCSDGDCILSTWRCDGYKDCKDYSDETNCSSLLTGGRRHPFLGLIGPVGCLVAALAIRVLLRTHQRRRLLQSNGETAAAAAALAAMEARSRRARSLGHGADVDPERFDDEGRSPRRWVNRFGAGLSSSLAQLRVLFSQNGTQSTSLPSPPPYTETPTQNDLPPAYHGNPSCSATDIPPVFLLVIPAGKPPPTYTETVNPSSHPVNSGHLFNPMPDLVQSTADAASRNRCTSDEWLDDGEIDTDGTTPHYVSTVTYQNQDPSSPSYLNSARSSTLLPPSSSSPSHPAPTFPAPNATPFPAGAINFRSNPLFVADGNGAGRVSSPPEYPPAYEDHIFESVSSTGDQFAQTNEDSFPPSGSETAPETESLPTSQPASLSESPPDSPREGDYEDGEPFPRNVASLLTEDE